MYVVSRVIFFAVNMSTKKNWVLAVTAKKLHNATIFLYLRLPQIRKLHDGTIFCTCVYRKKIYDVRFFVLAFTTKKDTQFCNFFVLAFPQKKFHALTTKKN